MSEFKNIIKIVNCHTGESINLTVPLDIPDELLEKISPFTNNQDIAYFVIKTLNDKVKEIKDMLNTLMIKRVNIRSAILLRDDYEDYCLCYKNYYPSLGDVFLTEDEWDKLKAYSIIEDGYPYCCDEKNE